MVSPTRPSVSQPGGATAGPAVCTLIPSVWRRRWNAMPALGARRGEQRDMTRARGKTLADHQPRLHPAIEVLDARHPRGDREVPEDGAIDVAEFVRRPPDVGAGTFDRSIRRRCTPWCRPPRPRRRQRSPIPRGRDDRPARADAMNCRAELVATSRRRTRSPMGPGFCHVHCPVRGGRF